MYFAGKEKKEINFSKDNYSARLYLFVKSLYNVYTYVFKMIDRQKRAFSVCAPLFSVKLETSKVMFQWQAQSPPAIN